MVKGYRVSTDRSDMDIVKIHEYISASYWSGGIPLGTLQRAIDNSLCFAVISNTEGLVGFARMVTDYATYGYLADVFINESHRGKGLSKSLLDVIMAHPSLQGLRRITLATKDAHELYKQYGFTALSSPELFMEIWNPSIYKEV